ncbi:type II secretion system protein M [Thiohalorhabdus sp.]|uniref:type II secretion system protein M n=1 Tax=Thiohalorhabdus sp. TaxID=3094134 RepID=UPI002FC387BF
MLGAWWAERAPREKAALVAAGLAIVATIAYWAIAPVVQERNRLAREIPELRQDLSWMQDHLEEIRRMRAESGGSGQSSKANLTPAMVEQSLNGAGLAEQLEGLRPEGDGVRLVFEEVAFAELLEWLAAFRRRSAAVAKGARIERVDEAQGRVRARLTLAPRRAEE